jgi:hypothetical protein
MEPQQEHLDEFRAWLTSRGVPGEVLSERIEVHSASLQDFQRERPLQQPSGKEVRGENLIRVWWGDRYIQDFGEYRLVYDARTSGVGRA